ncbi:MAG: protein-L-isoaspartate O-methyltransferase, partial [Candidatus Bathyarchaeia archaeon]
YPEEAPYDRILVTAAAPSAPNPLKEQMKEGGVMVIPVGEVGFYQELLRLRKRDNRIIEEDLGGVAFVPLVGRYGHKISYRW